MSAAFTEKESFIVFNEIASSKKLLYFCFFFKGSSNELVIFVVLSVLSSSQLHTIYACDQPCVFIWPSSEQLHTS